MRVLMGMWTKRILIFLGMASVVLVAITVVLLATSGDPDPVAVDTTSSTSSSASSSTTSSTTPASSSTTSSTTSTTVAPTVPTTLDPPTPTVAPTTEAPAPTEDPSPPTTEPGPVELGRHVLALNSPDGFDAIILPPRVDFHLTAAGFEIGTPAIPGADKPWWIFSITPPGPEGCRDSKYAGATPVNDPVSLEVLAITEGWYGCIDVDNFTKFGQIHFLEVVPGGYVLAEVIYWDFAG